MCFSAIASIAGGAMQAGAARRAASAQERAAQQQMELQERMMEEQLALQRQMYNQPREDLGPYREAGYPAVEGANFLLGLGAAPTYTDADGNEVTYSYETSPGYEFARKENLDAIEGSAAARGGLYSGAAMQALGERANQLANLEFGNNFNRVMSVAGLGANAAGMQAQANQNNAALGTNTYLNNAQMGSTSLANMGDAQAAGIIGAGNAWGNALGDLSGLWGYQQNTWGGGGSTSPAASPAPSPMRPIMNPRY